jgi:hypothetical protein
MATLITRSTKHNSRKNIDRNDMTAKAMKQLHSHHRDSHHRHHYRESDIGLIANKDLASRLIEGYLPTIVIDTGNDEESNGQIRDALFCPERSFGEEQIKCLIQKANERRRLCNTGISNHKCYVVFYYRDSVKKGLRCAHRFHQAVHDLGENHGICTTVLRGGAGSWFKMHGNDHRLVQDFDKHVCHSNIKHRVPSRSNNRTNAKA